MKKIITILILIVALQGIAQQDTTNNKFAVMIGVGNITNIGNQSMLAVGGSYDDYSIKFTTASIKGFAHISTTTGIYGGFRLFKRKHYFINGYVGRTWSYTDRLNSSDYHSTGLDLAGELVIPKWHIAIWYNAAINGSDSNECGVISLYWKF